LTCTTQAPHWLVSQPIWVPVNFSVSRKNDTSKVLSGTSCETAAPFTVIVTLAIGLSLCGKLFLLFCLSKEKLVAVFGICKHGSDKNSHFSGRSA
jgi:hypothetical protein